MIHTMFFLCMMTLVAADTYSRAYLRGLHKAEWEREHREWIRNGTAYLEEVVVTAAKQGRTHYTTEPVHCEIFTGPNEFNLNRDRCETVVRELKIAVSERFPDSDLTYDEDTYRYTLYWGSN